MLLKIIKCKLVRNIMETTELKLKNFNSNSTATSSGLPPGNTFYRHWNFSSLVVLSHQGTQPKPQTRDRQTRRKLQPFFKEVQEEWRDYDRGDLNFRRTTAKLA